MELTKAEEYMQTKSKQMTQWYDQRGWALGLAAVLLLAAYLVASRAIYTGSWQQYFITFALMIGGFNRLFRSIKPKRV